MRKIDTPPSHPERAPYLRTESKLCDWIYVPTSGEYLDAIAIDEDIGAVQKGEYTIGALILLAWRDHHYELEATEPREVYRELYRAGHSEAEIGKLGTAIIEAVKAGQITQEEVNGAADFSDGTPGTDSPA